MQPSDEQKNRLNEAFQYSRSALGPFRKNRLMFLKQFVGYHYSDTAKDKPVPVNLLKIAVQTHVTQLVGGTPQASITSDNRQHRAEAYNFQLALNKYLKRMRLEEKLEEGTTDAMFSVGIAKVGIADENEVYDDGKYQTFGKPFVDIISLDDWVQDMTASDVRGACFMGHCFDMPVDAAKERFGKEIAEEEYSPLQEDGAPRDQLARSDQGMSGNTSYIKKTKFWELYFPHEKKIRVYRHEGGGDGADCLGDMVEEKDYKGPEGGLYYFLDFDKVPNNPMPVSPVMTWYDLHYGANIIWRKAQRQAERQKSLGIVGPGSEDDGDRITNYNDGDVIRCDNPSGVQSLTFGGVNADNVQFYDMIFNQWNIAANNPMTLAGLGNQSPTLGQDKLLHEAANAVVARMQERVVRWTGEIIGAIAWYLYTDPVLEIPIEKKIPGTRIPPIESSWTPEKRKADFFLYNVDIQPYSLQRNSPQQKMLVLQQYLAQVLIPMQQQILEQGGTIDTELVGRMFADGYAVPELEDVVRYDKPPSVPVKGAAAPPSRGPQMQPPGGTKRTYERVSTNGNQSPLGAGAGGFGKQKQQTRFIPT